MTFTYQRAHAIIRHIEYKAALTAKESCIENCYT